MYHVERPPRSPPRKNDMRPLVLAALLAGGGAAPSHRSLGDGGWHAAHPGFVSPTTKAPATNAAAQRPVFDPAKQLRGCAGVDTLNSNFQHNKFQMVVALKPWRFLATIEMRFKSVSAREAAGLNLAKTAGARVLGWLPAARGRPQSLFFQTTTNAINTGLGGNSFRVEGVGTIDTKAVTFHIAASPTSRRCVRAAPSSSSCSASSAAGAASSATTTTSDSAGSASRRGSLVSRVRL